MVVQNYICRQCTSQNITDVNRIRCMLTGVCSQIIIYADHFRNCFEKRFATKCFETCTIYIHELIFGIQNKCLTKSVSVLV